jgi:hypothetical protein
MRVRKTTAALWLIGLAGLALAIAGPMVLPERYYFDAMTVRELLADRHAEGSESFVSTAHAYRLLGFTVLWPDALAGPLSFALAFGAVVLGARLAEAPWRPAAFALLALWTVPMAIFHGTHSKEVFAIVAIGVMARVARNAPGVALAAGIALLYALGFRSYWAVIVVLYVVLMAGWRVGLGWTARLALVALAIVPLSLASEHFVGYWLSDGRTVVVEAREGDIDSATLFHNPWPNTSPATDLANSLAGWLMLILPFHLLALGAAQHAAFALFQFANTATFVRIARALPRPTRDRAPSRGEWLAASAAAWCVAYTIVQGMFEPDFGSFVKHEANLVPLLMALATRPAARADDARRSGNAAPVEGAA